MSENFNPPKQVVDSAVEQMLAQFENQTAAIALEQKLQQIRHEAAQEAALNEVPEAAQETEIGNAVKQSIQAEKLARFDAALLQAAGATLGPDGVWSLPYDPSVPIDSVPPPHCAFCGADESKAEVLLKGKEAYICGVCATNCERLTREAHVRKRLKGERLQTLEAENAELKRQLELVANTLRGLLPPE